MTAVTFGRRLREAVTAHGRLCVGIDPHAHLLHDWGLPDTAGGARDLGLRVVDAATGRVGVVKPQVAFFERHGSAGVAALEDVIRAARAAGLLVIADAKRGDIGSTMRAYADAWLRPGAPLEADALTVSPYLGVPVQTLNAAVDAGKGVFVLAATSNPEGERVQRARLGHGTLAADVAVAVGRVNAARTPDGEWGSVGLVVGATIDHARLGLPAALTPPTPILAPGFGYQGARVSDVDRLFGAQAAHTLVSASRSILSAGPTDLVAAIDAHRTGMEAVTRG